MLLFLASLNFLHFANSNCNISLLLLYVLVALCALNLKKHQFLKEPQRTRCEWNNSFRLNGTAQGTNRPSERLWKRAAGIFFYYNITYGSRTPLMKERRVMHMYNIERERAFWILNRDRQITEMLVKSRNLQFPSKFALLIGPLMLLLLLKLVQLWRSIGFQSIILALCGNSFLDNIHSFISPSLVKTIVRFKMTLEWS